MTAKDLLALMRLLSALESWAMSQKEPMPCYLSDDISAMIQKIEHEILRTRQINTTNTPDQALIG